jgi:hypothetical protein
MSLPRANANRCTDDDLDGLIRCVLQESVAGAEPSPLVWERIQEQVAGEERALTPRSRAPHKSLSRRLWLGWLIGAGASFPVPGDPRAAWQRRLHVFDVRAPASIIRIIEGKMPSLRLVS